MPCSVFSQVAGRLDGSLTDKNELATGATGDATGNVVHRATPASGSPVTPATPDVEIIVRVAAMEAELRGLKDMVAELRQARDGWQAQAERVTQALPAPERRSWWKRIAG